MKGASYVAKQRDGGAASSADEEEVSDDESDAAELDEEGENKSVNFAQSIKSKNSAIKKKREIVSFVFLHLLLLTWLLLLIWTAVDHEAMINLRISKACISQSLLLVLYFA